MMKKVLVMLFLITLLTGCAESSTKFDKSEYPDGGIVVFVGYDKSLYFLLDDVTDIDLSQNYGSYTLNYGNDNSFTSTDVRYEYVYKNREDLNKLLKQFGHKEIK